MPDDAAFIDALRECLGLRPLPREAAGFPSPRFTLDGVRKLTTREWCRELGISRQAVAIRRATLTKRLALGLPDAYELAVAARCVLMKRKRPERVGRKLKRGRAAA